MFYCLNIVRPAQLLQSRMLCVRTYGLRMNLTLMLVMTLIFSNSIFGSSLEAFPLIEYPVTTTPATRP